MREDFDRKHCFISPESPNKSVCITGHSRSGKTCRLNQIELKNTKKNHNCCFRHGPFYAKDQVSINIRQQYINFENHIYAVKDGFDLCLFHPLKELKK